MSVKISIFKSTSDGEQTNVEYNLEKRDFDRMGTPPQIIRYKDGREELIPGKPGESLRQILEPYFRLMDDRLLEMNLRIMASNKMIRKLSPESQVAFHNVMEVLHGHRPVNQEWAEILKQSIKEVQEDLVKQGYNREQIEKTLVEVFGQDSVVVPPRAEVNPLEPTATPEPPGDFVEPVDSDAPSS